MLAWRGRKRGREVLKVCGGEIFHCVHISILSSVESLTGQMERWVSTDTRRGRKEKEGTFKC